MRQEWHTTSSATHGWLSSLALLLCSFYLYSVVWLVAGVTLPVLLTDLEPVAITSGSMVPRIDTGDVVLNAPYRGGELRRNQVVTFRDPSRANQLITHRIVGLNPDGTFRTRGDANDAADSAAVTKAQIEGVGRALVPRASMPLVWLDQRNLLPLAAWPVTTMLAAMYVSGFGRLLVRSPGTWSVPLAPQVAVPVPRAPRGSVARRAGRIWLRRWKTLVDWQRPIRPRAAVGMLLVWVLVAGGFVTGVAQGAFTDSTQPPGNDLQTADAFSPKANNVVGTASSCAALSTAITVPASGVSAGNTLVLRVAGKGASTVAGGYSATDNRGNTYSVDADAIRTTNGVRALVLSARVTTPLVAGDTITVSHPSAQVHSVVATQLAGISAVGRVDATGTGAGASVAPSAAITTVTGSTLTIGSVAANLVPTFTSAAGWTTMQSHAPVCGGNSVGNYADYRLTTPAAYTYAPTLSTSRDWAVALVAYKAADFQAPAAPTLSGVNGDSEATLTWTQVTDPTPPITYQLYRDGVEVYSGTALTYHDTSPVNGTPYVYRVRATDAAGNQSAQSNALTLTPTAGASIRFVKTIGGVTCGGGANSTSIVTVPAGGVAAGNTLLVRYAARESTNATLVTQVAVSDSRGNQYTLDAYAASGTRLLTAVMGGYISTALQAGDTITISSPTGNFHIAGITEYSGMAPTDRVIATASESANGGTITPDLSVNMSETKAMLYATVTTRDASTATVPSGWTDLPAVNATACANTGTTHAAYRRPATTGVKTYTTTLSATREKASILLAYRAQVDLTAPAAPTLSGTNGREENTLTWTSVTDPTTPITYQLTRDGQQVYSGTATTFTDTGLTNGAAYSYTVRATDGADNQSGASNTLSLTPTPIAFVQQLGTSTCRGAGASVTSPVTVPAGGVAAGNTVLLRVVLSKPVPEAGVISAIDSRGNTYTLDRDETRPSRVRTAILSGYIATPLQAGDTITVTHPGATASAVTGEEFMGIAASNRVDASAGVNNQTAAPSVAVTTSALNTLVYAALGTETANRAHTPPGAPWTALGALVTSPCATDNHGAYLRPTPIATYTYTATLTGGTAHWAGAAVAYRSAVDTTAPNAPVLTGSPGNGHNDLSWTAVTDPSSPVTYQLYRDGQLVYDGTATTFSDTGRTNGVTYGYVVQAKDSVDNVSAASNTVSLIPSPIELIKEVGRQTCGGTSSAITVPAAGVTAGRTVLVRVVVREGADAGAVTVTDSKGNTYTKDADAVRPGKVRAVILSGLISTPLVSGDTITATHPAGTGQVVIADEFNGIAEANRVESVGTGSDNSALPTASVTTTNGRNLLYGALGTRTATATPPAGWNALGAGVSPACTAVTTGHGAYRSTEAPGTFPYTPTPSGSDEWAAALVAYRSALDLTPPDAPVLTGAVGNTQNTLNWTAVTDPSGPVTYQVFRGATEVYSGPATSFTDTGLVNSVAYTYTVKASDSALNQSVASNSVTLIPTPIALIGTVGTLTCGAGGGVITVPAAGVAAGKTVIVRLTIRAGTDANAVTITDSKGNTYQEDVAAVWPTDKVRTAVFSARVTTPLVQNDTITITHGSGSVQAAAMAFSGIRDVGRRHTFASASASNALPTVSVTTAEPSTLLLAVVGTRAVRVFNPPASGWTAFDSLLCAGNSDNHAAWRLTSTAGLKSYDATLTGGNDEWAAVLVAYRPE